MKRWLLAFAVLFFSLLGKTQPRDAFAPVQGRAEAIVAPTPDSLGRTISREFATPGERLRAIYCWITAHIAYNTAIYKPWSARYRYDADPLDTVISWPSGDEMVARKVMRQGKAVCDGYSRLFKVLCDYAGLEAVVIQGFGRGYRSDKFKTNHTWNAVKLDSTWYLLDLTWAAGYMSLADDYIASRNDEYYLAQPQRFFFEHHPEDLRWALLAQPPVLSDFKRTPFRTKNFTRYGFASFLPGTGNLEATPGDTLKFQLGLSDPTKVGQIGADPFTDSAGYALWPNSSFATPVAEVGGTVWYAVPVREGTEWINLLYKGDVVVRYHLRQKEYTVGRKVE